MRFVECADGRPLGVQEIGAGSAEPALVVPGGPCRDPAYLGDLAGLSAVRPMAIVHPRGTPATGGLSHGWWNDAADVIAVADALGLPVFDLVAHSAGTRLAVAVAAQHADRVRSLALITPAAAWLTGTADDGPALAAARGEPEIAEAVASLSGPTPTDEQSFQRAWQLENPAGYAQWTTRERAHSVVGAMSWAAAAAWFTDIPDDAAARIVAAHMPPTLVVGGAADILSGVAPVRAYARALDAELVLIEHAGHYPWVEQPAAFRQVLDPWLALPRAR